MQNNSLSNLKEIGYFRSKNLESHLIVDTNVLLLFLVGVYNPDYLKDCFLMRKNDKFYGIEHFELIKKIISCFLYKVVITPHILSEMNMLSRTKIEPKLRLSEYFLKIIKELEKWKEDSVELKVLLENNTSIVEFGFTDISLVEIAKKNKENNWIILTDDFKLYNTFLEKIPIIYFSNVMAHEILLK